MAVAVNRILAAAGRRVEIVEMTDKLADGLNQSRRRFLLKRLSEHGVAAHLLTKAAFGSANTLLRCDVRSRRGLCLCSQPRNSKTMFNKPFCAPFHLWRLSVTVLPAYSSLHRLFCIKFSVICILVYTLSLFLSTDKIYREMRGNLDIPCVKYTTTSSDNRPCGL